MPDSPKYQVRPYYKLRNTSSIKAHAAGASDGTWTVPALCTAYDWPANQAGGSVIAIVELGGGWVQSDMDAFFQSVDQPSPQITDVSVDGTTNSPNQSVGSARSGLLDH